MWSASLPVGLLLVSLLVQRGQQSCMTGTVDECEEAEFAPGSDLAGEGFDITTMARRGAFVIDLHRWANDDGTCTLCTNPFAEDKKQKLPLSVVDWRAEQRCGMKVSSSVFKSSEELVTASSSMVENDWKVGLDLEKKGKKASLMMAGTHSKLAEYSMAKSKSDRFSFTSHSISCTFYSYRTAHRPKLHREFNKALKDLPKTYSVENKQRFYQLIDTFGTHYITKLAGRVKSVTSVRQCLAGLQGLTVDEVQMCLNAEASASVGGQAVKAEGKHCQKDSIQGGKTTDPDILFSSGKDPSAYKEWLSSLPQLPGIISHSLSPLHELLPTNCPTRKSLRTAIDNYIVEKALWTNCSEPCQLGVKRSQSEPCVCSCQGNAAVTPDCCPARRGMARVVVVVQSATGLWGDYTTATDGYVKVTVGTLAKRRTPVIWNNNNPRWDTTIDLGYQDLSSESMRSVRFEVWDQDNTYDDDLLGECTKALSRGAHQDVCNFSYGRLYIKWEVTCAPNLGGAACVEYVKAPIAQHLQKAFVSRHSQHVPDAILREYGVLGVGVSGRHGNQSVALSPFSRYR
ncbi:hypothetical protein CRUP_008509, partial [Coryphaenoides rupestris]